MNVPAMRNEQRKLLAGLFNGVAMAVFIAGFITPFFAGMFVEEDGQLLSQTFTEFTFGEVVLYIVLVLSVTGAFHLVARSMLTAWEEDSTL